jgi:hypothetical protein
MNRRAASRDKNKVVERDLDHVGRGIPSCTFGREAVGWANRRFASAKPGVFV